MGNTFYFQWEPTLMVWIQNILGQVGGEIAGVITSLGEETVMVAILGFIYWCYDKKFGVYVGTNLMVGLVANPMIKNIFLRHRPYMVHSEVKCLKQVHEGDLYDPLLQGYSFPSGHTSNASTMYFSLPVYGKKKWLVIMAIIMPLLIGVSRVCLGVHYPTDVIAGWILGAVVVTVMTYLQNKVKTKWKLYLWITVFSIPGCFYCTSNDYYTALGMMMGFFAANLYEEKYVKFETTTLFLKSVIRVVCGLAVFLIANAILKAALGVIAIEELENMIRVLRYGILVFITMGVYPMAFRWKKVFG
ncbi:MAG: phosphatase PAP2 family protein [Lachnospiraceae bacterium]|nr:phosphatase PAP2 family protein [Lachnospiraceae bacterium]